MAPTIDLPAEIDIAIIGSGFGGICAAIQLLKTGRTSFVILEKADWLGGTWRDNDYPGCACDVPSHLYSFSFEPNPNWSRTYSPQAEINAYIARCAEKYGVMEKIAFNHEVTKRKFNDNTKSWEIEIKDRQKLSVRIIISAMGGLHEPLIPNLPGQDRFKGTSFHSARWDHGFDLTNKKVAIVGTGASTIQFLPPVAEKARSVVVFQRTPPWVIPRHDNPVSPWRQTLYAKIPTLQRLHRYFQYWSLESRAVGFTLLPHLMKFVRRWGENNIKKAFDDDTTIENLKPDYLPGCKRILMSNDYYPALARPNVNLKTAAAKEIRAHSIVCADDEEFEVDAIIYGTGFKFGEQIAPGAVLGPRGRDLGDQWRKDGPEAYYGLAVSGFPNLFFLSGPNTGLGHNSIVFMIEAQVQALLKFLNWMDQDQARLIEVKDDVQTSFNRWVQERFNRTIWVSGCNSWYREGQDGKVVALWPGFSFSFRWQIKNIKRSAFKMKS